MTKILFNSLVGLSLALAGCGKRDTSAANSSSSPAANFDACSLLTRAEVESVVGSPVKDTKSSGNASGGLRTSQCFYSTAEFNRSVNLAVTSGDHQSDSKRAAKARWEESFGRYRNEEQERAKEDENEKEKRESLQEQRPGKGEEEEATPPKKISGIGDEAFWTANRVGGDLYVLKNNKNVFIRISVGGPDPQQAKIDKSKALAQKALDRM